MNHGKQQHWLSECLGYRLHLSDCVGAGGGGGEGREDIEEKYQKYLTDEIF
jgi:hypothetical protein